MPRSPANRLSRIAIFIAVAAGAFLLLMFAFQTQIVFPTHAVGAPGPLPPGAQRLDLRTADGATLHGVHVPPRGTSSDTLLLVFAGNAWNSEDAVSYLHQLFPQTHVVGFHYRGYRPSTGSPSAKALMADAPLVMDAALARVRPKRVVAVGFSIGSGVAAALAARRELDGVILVTPFDSLKAVASTHYPMIPGMFFEHEMNAAAALKRSDVPVAIIAAENDTLIPPARTHALGKGLKTLRFERTIANSGHNDIYWRSDFHRAMTEALAALTR